MKAVFLYEMKRIFARVQTYAYLILSFASVCAAFTVRNFTTGYLRTDKALALLGLAFLITLPLLTSESFSGDNGMQRTFRSLGVSSSKCYFGRLMATLTVALIPAVLTLVIPPMLRTMGEANMLSSYLALIGLILTVAALTSAFTTVSVCCETPLYSYAVSYAVALLFYGVKRICEGLHGADALRSVMSVFAPTYTLSGLSEERFLVSSLVLPLITAVVVIAVGLIMSDKTQISDGVLFKRAAFKIAAASVAVCLALSLIFGMIPTGADLTKNAITKLSDGAVNEIKNIDSEVTVSLVTPKDAVNHRMKTVLENMAAENEKITVELLDPDEYGATIQQYTSDLNEAMFGAVIVKSAKRSVYIPYHEFYSYSDEAYINLINTHYIFSQSGSTLTLPQHILVYSENDELYIHDGYRYEEGIIEAISYCLADDVKTVYAVGNVKPSNDLVRLAMRRYTEIKQLSLGTKDIPSDCDAILLSLTRDLTENEREKLSDYLDNGGKMIASADYGVKYTVLNSLLSDYGISVDSSLILEDDTNYSYNNNPLLSNPVIADSGILSAIGTESKLLLTAPTPIIISDTLPEGVTVKALMTSSDTSYTKGEDATGETFDPEKDTRGKRNVCVRATDGGGAELILLSSGYLSAEDYEPSRNRACKGAFFYLLSTLTEGQAVTPVIAPKTAICPTGAKSPAAMWGSIGVCSALALAFAVLGFKKAFRA